MQLSDSNNVLGPTKGKIFECLFKTYASANSIEEHPSSLDNSKHFCLLIKLS